MFYCPLVHLLVQMLRVQHSLKERISMGSKHFFRFSALVLAVLLIFSLAACTLSASKGISGETETTGDFPVPDDENMGLFDATPTTVAALPAAGESTPPPAFTATPLPVVAPTATAVSAVLPVATEGKPPATYTLKKGEFPFCIARRFNVDQNEMLAINGLGLNSQVQPGTTLKIPQTGNHFISERSLIKHPAQYTVAAGDTFYTIACKFGDVSPDMIAQANNMSESDSLTAGKVLQIP
jgi:LysM repeat protein